MRRAFRAIPEYAPKHFKTELFVLLKNLQAVIDLAEATGRPWVNHNTWFRSDRGSILQAAHLGCLSHIVERGRDPAARVRNTCEGQTHLHTT